MKTDVLVGESVLGGHSPIRVDREANIVYNVKVSGFRSKNGRRYTRNAFANALPLYEGAIVNADHPAIFRQTNPPAGVPSDQVEARHLSERFAQLKGVTLKDDGLYAAEMHCDPDHPYTKSFYWWAERAPDKVVLSQVVGYGGRTTKDPDGTIVINEIKKVQSVDAVGSGGTNRTLYESVPDMADEITQPNEFEQFLRGLFPGDMTFGDMKARISAGLKALEVPQTYKGTVAEAMRELSDSSDARIRLVVESLDARIVAEAAAQKRLAASKACADAGLDENVVSEVFLDSLTRTDPANWSGLISDRKDITAHRPSNPPRSLPSGSDKLTLDQLCANVKANR